MFDIDHKIFQVKMFNRRNFLIKSISSLLYLPFSACTKAVGLSSMKHENKVNKLSDPLGLNKSTKRFSTLLVTGRTKALATFDFFGEYFGRPDDKWKPLVFQSSKAN